jgi:methionyl-tRNA formyltransferase
VKARALELSLPLLQPVELDSPFLQEVSLLKPDLLVSVAYGKIFKKDFLDLFPMGGINLHPSLLPRYRGPSPLTAAILAGDVKTGITVQRLALRMDSGDILLQREIPLDGTETTGSLSEDVAPLGAEMLVEAVRGLEEGSLAPVPQDNGKATYCSIVTKEDGLIDWSRSAVEIDRLIRAYSPWPGAFTSYQDKTLKIIEAGVFDAEKPSSEPGIVAGIDKGEGILIQTCKGILAVRRLQLQAKKALGWKDFLNGVQDFSGSVLGEHR